MCQPITCATCGKTTWTGCGEHVDSVRVHVPADQWCEGHGDAPTVAPAAQGIFGRLLGRS